MKLRTLNPRMMIRLPLYFICGTMETIDWALTMRLCMFGSGNYVVSKTAHEYIKRLTEAGVRTGYDRVPERVPDDWPWWTKPCSALPVASSSRHACFVTFGRDRYVFSLSSNSSSGSSELYLSRRDRHTGL